MFVDEYALIEAAEKILRDNNGIDSASTKLVAKMCMQTNDEYTRALGIEILGLRKDSERVYGGL